ncbi:hypothetical protein [Psychromicrobium xiongbiense]|uniref:hypothetical protein n=1 Tax=Psychromicrobium xiongbiense TaxID=3051184 RepID=UPI002554B3B6|nr:hypothetical protein [Psychromicrobium sp. YIM S02556]
MAEVRAGSRGLWPGGGESGGGATGEVLEAIRIQLGELGAPHLPSLPLLPGRGPVADPIGRTAAMLVEMPVDLQSYGWRLTSREGSDGRRARNFLRSDVNALADVVGARESTVPDLALHLVGPLTLAAGVHLPLGERALADPGARRDLAQSQRDGFPEQLRAVREATPGTRLTVVVDEPEAARALAGMIPTVSGYRSLRSVPRSEAQLLWREMRTALLNAGASEVCLAVPLEVLAQAREAGLDSVQVDPAEGGAHRWDPASWEPLAAWLDQGRQLTLRLPGMNSSGGRPSGARPAVGRLPGGSGVAETARAFWRLWRELGLGAETLGALRLVEAGDLSLGTPAQAQAALGHSTAVAAALTELAQS